MGNIGLFWIPATVAVQLILLYAVLGGPSRLLAQLAGDERLAGATVLNKVQMGLPVALVLAFPALVTLAVLERLLGQVGVVELLVVESGFLLLLLRILQRRQLAAGDTTDQAGDVPVPLATEVPEPPAVVVAMPSNSPLPPLPTIPTVSPAAVPCRQAASSLDGPQGLLNRLNRIYLWDDVGGERAFAEARRQSPSAVMAGEEIAELGSAAVAQLRAVVHETLASLGTCEAVWREEDFSPEPVLDVDAYQRDVMRRLVLSVWSGCERLYVDQTDVELCGKRKLLLMYRLALSEIAPSHLH